MNLNKKKINLIYFVFLIFLSVECTNDKNSSGVPKQRSEQNSLTQYQKDNGWKLLFDGKTTNGWREVWGDAFPEKNWVIKNGSLSVLASNGEQGGGGGSIITKYKFSDFIFQTDFKLFNGTNSGIKYFVVENKEFFLTNPELTKKMGIGLEYQMIDEEKEGNAHRGANETTGSLYEMIPAVRKKQLNPRGKWNHAKIISKGNHVEHWLNGEKILQYERGSDNFVNLVNKSKYEYANFGLATEGHILLQNHGTKVCFRNIMIKRL